MPESINAILASYFESLSHPTRIEILELLKTKTEMCVCDIVARLKKDQSNISRHLNSLKQVGILEFRAEGIRSFYKIKNKDVYKILDLVKPILHKEIKESQKVLAAL